MLMANNTIPFVTSNEWLLRTKGHRKNMVKCHYCNKDFAIGETITKYGRKHFCHYPECYDIVYIDIPDSILEGDETKWIIL